MHKSILPLRTCYTSRVLIQGAFSKTLSNKIFEEWFRCNVSAAIQSSDNFLLGGAVRDIADLEDTVGARATVMERVDRDKA